MNNQYHEMFQITLKCSADYFIFLSFYQNLLHVITLYRTIVILGKFNPKQ